jgi:hypothetical protein
MEIALVVAFVLLLMSHRELRRQLKAAATHSAERMNAGDRVPSLSVTDFSGKDIDLDLRNGRFIVAVVNPTCPSCAESIQAIQNVRDSYLISVSGHPDDTRLLGALKSASRTYVVSPRHPQRKLLSTIPQVFVVEQGTVARTCRRVSDCL